MKLQQRPRRLRKNSLIRSLVDEHQLNKEQLIYPLFVSEVCGVDEKIAIETMPGLFRFGEAALLLEIEDCIKLGLKKFALFPALKDSNKNAQADSATDENNLVCRVLRAIKKKFPDTLLIADVALDPFTDTGHDGLVDEKGQILNDETVEILKKMSLCFARAGADMVAPSDMMDGRIGAIREYLDQNGKEDCSIMAYTAKYASSFYGPFREALDSAPQFGDKKTYQMSPANASEALRELSLDESEGANIVMVKPALAYLDIISLLRANTELPIAAYNVSGEYAMIQFAAQAGALDYRSAVEETLLSIHRAGAQIILTYFAKEYYKWHS